jgi:hypothetical protein
VPKFYPFEVFLASSVLATAVTVIACAGVALAPMGSRVMAVSFVAAAAGAPTSAVLWAARWVRKGAIAYLVDAMLTQRARHHGETHVQPLRAVQSGH